MTFSNISYFFRCCVLVFSFSIFGLGSLVLSFIVFPLVSVLIYKKNRVAFNRLIVKKSFACFLMILRWQKVVSIDTSELLSLKTASPSIVIANHPTLIDIVILFASCPNADCVVKADLLQNFFLRRIVLSCDFLVNNDPINILEQTKKRLAQGSNIIIFPEGTRSIIPNKVNYPLHRGAANLIVRTQASFRFISINSDQPFLTKQNKWYRTTKQRANIYIKVEQSFNYLDLVDLHELSLPKQSRVLTKSIYQTLQDNLNKYHQHKQHT